MGIFYIFIVLLLLALAAGIAYLLYKGLYQLFLLIGKKYSKEPREELSYIFFGIKRSIAFLAISFGLFFVVGITFDMRKKIKRFFFPNNQNLNYTDTTSVANEIPSDSTFGFSTRISVDSLKLRLLYSQFKSDGVNKHIHHLNNLRLHEIINITVDTTVGLLSIKETHYTVTIRKNELVLISKFIARFELSPFTSSQVPEWLLIKNDLISINEVKSNINRKSGTSPICKSAYSLFGRWACGYERLDAELYLTIPSDVNIVESPSSYGMLVFKSDDLYSNLLDEFGPFCVDGNNILFKDKKLKSSLKVKNNGSEISGIIEPSQNGSRIKLNLRKL